MTPEVCKVTSDTQHTPKCVPRNTNDSGAGMFFPHSHIFGKQEIKEIYTGLCAEGLLRPLALCCAL